MDPYSLGLGEIFSISGFGVVIRIKLFSIQAILRRLVFNRSPRKMLSRSCVVSA